MKAAGHLQQGAADAEICREISPRPGDIVVTKRKTSSFFGT
ncbi:isochorismatase family protein, partial [Thermodesulfobacteriota bacterium]